MVKCEAQKSTSVNILDGGSSQRGQQTRVALLAGARAGNGYLLYTRLLTLFFEMTLNCFPQKLEPIKEHY
jgi:hypothetical protein